MNGTLWEDSTVDSLQNGDPNPHTNIPHTHCSGGSPSSWTRWTLLDENLNH